MYTDRFTSTLEDAGAFDRRYADDYDDRPSMADVADGYPRRGDQTGQARTPEPGSWASLMAADPWLEPGALPDAPPF